MSRFRRFEGLEKQRPAGSAAPARRSSVTDRFSAADAPTTAATEPPVARSQGTPERFEAEPAARSLRLLDLDDGQPFVRCAQCRADTYVTATACSHCGADLMTHEQRAYNESYWRRRQAEEAEQRVELAKLQAAREKAEQEAADARRRLMEQVRERRHASDTVDDENEARELGRWSGARLRRAFPNRSHRIAFTVTGLLALGGLVVLVIASPTLRTTIVVLSIVAGLVERFRRFWRE